MGVLIFGADTQDVSVYPKNVLVDNLPRFWRFTREDGPHIKLWMPEHSPDRLKSLILFDEESGTIVMFAAHAPAAVFVGKSYQEYHSNPFINGWIREGELGLFGTNALDVIPHPEGDGILVVGSCV